MTELTIIAALGMDNEIGVRRDKINLPDEMPWRLDPYKSQDKYKLFRKADMAHFRELTGDFPVIMGRKTYESIPKKFRPLQGRDNLVLSSSFQEEGVQSFTSMDGLITHLNNYDEAYNIGGGTVYDQSLSLFAENKKPLVTKLELTRLHELFPMANVFFPKLDLDVWKLDASETFYNNGSKFYSFETYVRK